jgi:hypothetical protein
MKGLGHDVRFKVAMVAFTHGAPITITQIRQQFGWPNDLSHTRKLRYALEHLVDCNVFLKRQGDPGKADEYEVNPEYAAEVLAFLHTALT